MQHRRADHESKQQHAMIQLLKIGMRAKHKSMQEARAKEEQEQKREHAKLQESITTSIMPGGLSAMSITAPLSLNWGVESGRSGGLNSENESINWGGEDSGDEAEKVLNSMSIGSMATRITGTDRIKSMQQFSSKLTAGLSFFGSTGAKSS